MDWVKGAARIMGMTKEDKAEIRRTSGAGSYLYLLTQRHIKKYQGKSPDEIMAKFATYTSAPFPEDSDKIAAWMWNEVESSFLVPKTSLIYDLSGKVGEFIQSELCKEEWVNTLFDYPNIHHANEALAQALASRIESICASGMELVSRVIEESRHLSQLDNKAVKMRFDLTPKARIDEIPMVGPERETWIREVLLGENAIIKQGLVSPETAMKIAARINIRMIPRLLGAKPYKIEFAEYHADLLPWKRIETQAENISCQDPEKILSRFSKIPGTSIESLPADKNLKLQWIYNALVCETVRRASGLLDSEMGGDTPRKNVVAGIEIKLENISVGAYSDTGFPYRGILYVDGIKICWVSSHTGPILATGWEIGFSDADINLLEEYISKTGEPRLTADGEIRPDTLGDRLLDQVSMFMMSKEYGKATENRLLFLTDANDDARMLSVTIPPNGTKENAREHVIMHHPEAVFLEDMPQEDAVLLWSAKS